MGVSSIVEGCLWGLISDQNISKPSNWNVTDTLDTNHNYFSFSVEAAEGYQLNISNLYYQIAGEANAPGLGIWGYTTDGGQSWTYSDVFNIKLNSGMSSVPTGETWDFADFTAEAGTSVEFRFWAYGTTAINGPTSLSTADIRIYQVTGANRDLYLNGTVTQVPEASSYGWLAGTGALIALLVRRLRK